uniref:Ig-like domain-containing protein n=1 Tax=Cyprinus carpio TaxID=7962 RepID=A0A8C1LLH0_CYPCA
PWFLEKHDSEGENVTLSCNYSITSEYLHWYRQYGKSKPEFLVLTYDTKKDAQWSDVDPRFSANISKSQYVDLEISSAAVSDSALYYCYVNLCGNFKDTLH